MRCTPMVEYLASICNINNICNISGVVERKNGRTKGAAHRNHQLEGGSRLDTITNMCVCVCVLLVLLVLLV